MDGTMDFFDILRTALTQALGPSAIVYALAAIGLNIHFGYTGLLNFGQAAFAAVGGYAMAVSIASFDVPLLPAILLGIVAAILAWALFLPTLSTIPKKLSGWRASRACTSS